MGNKNKISLGRVFLYICVYILAFLWLSPIIWMFISSLKPMGTPVSVLSTLLSPPFTFANYSIISEKAPIWIWTLNSAVVAIAVTIGTIIITSLAAYAISRIDFYGKNFVFIMISAGLMVPIESIVIPLYKTMVGLKLLNSYQSLIFPSLAAPLGVLIMKQYYDSLPNELFEAARIDGAGIFTIWRVICLPLAKSSMAAVGIFTFTNSWNNFLWPFLSINSEKMMTLPVGIPLFQGAYQMEFTLPMTAGVIATVPALIVFIIFQKQIIQGIAMSGIKG
jgi:multiple sugar transport system permease protein